MWKAMRWADFGPMPGSLPSSSMRVCTAPSYTWAPTFVHVGEVLDLGGAVGVALFDQARVENFFDDAAPCDSGFFDDFVIIRGIVVVIVGGFILVDGRFGVLFCGLFTSVLGDHVGKAGPGGLGPFTLGFFGARGRGDDVAKAAFEFFAQLGLGLGKGRSEGLIIWNRPWDEPGITVGGHRIRFGR